MIITSADTAYWNKSTGVANTGTGRALTTFTPDGKTLNVKSIVAGSGAVITDNGQDLVINSTGGRPNFQKARITSSAVDSIKVDDEIIIYNGTVAANISIPPASQYPNRTIKISNNSTVVIKVGIYTIPARSWREWVSVVSINDWFQFQSGLVL